MKGIYANITWYTLVIVGLINAGYYRHTSHDWRGMTESRLNYDLLFGSLVIFLVICIIGLFRKKKWGYYLAVSANATLTISPICVLVVTLVMTYQELSILDIFQINSENLITGAISLVFWVWLVKSDIRKNFI